MHWVAASEIVIVPEKPHVQHMFTWVQSRVLWAKVIRQEMVQPYNWKQPVSKRHPIKQYSWIGQVSHFGDRGVEKDWNCRVFNAKRILRLKVFTWTSPDFQSIQQSRWSHWIYSSSCWRMDSLHRRENIMLKTLSLLVWYSIPAKNRKQRFYFLRSVQTTTVNHCQFLVTHWVTLVQHNLWLLFYHTFRGLKWALKN